MFASVGRQKLLERPEGTIELAKLLGTTASQVSRWRSGNTRPTSEYRNVIAARFPDIQPHVWELAPGVKPPPGLAPTVPDIPAGDPLPAEIDSGHLARLIAQVQSCAAELPAKERYQALERAARLVLALQKREADSRSARQDFLSSDQWARDLAELWRHIGPVGQQEVAAALTAWAGSDMPAAQIPAPNAQPFAITDFGQLSTILETAERLASIGEHRLAHAELQKLHLEVHADDIARLLLSQSNDVSRDWLDRLSVIASRDALVIRKSFNTLFAIRDCQSLPPEARKSVASLLALLKQTTIARAILERPVQ